MSLQQADLRLSIAPGVRALVNSRGVHILFGTRSFSTENREFPWDILFTTCWRGPICRTALAAELRAASPDINRQYLDDVLDELIRCGILGPLDLSPTATCYHLSSRFGHFEEPLATQVVAPTPPPGDERTFICKDGLNSSVADALLRRRSMRDFEGGAITKSELKTILWAAYGRTSLRAGRTVPSAGGIYPLLMKTVSRIVDGLKGGAYDFAPEICDLSFIVNTESLFSASWFRTEQITYEKVAAIIFVVADLQRCCAKYGERGYRYALLEAGHVAQNIALAAACLNMRHVYIGAFDDDAVNSALCTTSEYAVYAVALGR
jgi:SagB-type dehydrogenase family enzyme